MSRYRDIDADEAGAGGHDTGLWIYSYADVVTLLLGFFIMMYMFSETNEKAAEAMSEAMREKFQAGDASPKEVKENIEQRKSRALTFLMTILGLSPDQRQALQQIEASYKSMKDSETAKQVVHDFLERGNREIVDELTRNEQKQNMVTEITLPVAMLFETGSHTLTAEAHRNLSDLAVTLLKLTDLVEIEVIGHTDSLAPQRPAVYENNFTLSSMRGGAVVSALIAKGIGREKLALRGVADLQPLLRERRADNSLIEENMQKNRRVQIVIKRIRVPSRNDRALLDAH